MQFAFNLIFNAMNPNYAICINNSDYQVSLELHKVYRIMPDLAAKQEGDLRVIDESGEDYLCPRTNFLMIDLP